MGALVSQLGVIETITYQYVNFVSTDDYTKEHGPVRLYRVDKKTKERVSTVNMLFNSLNDNIDIQEFCEKFNDLLKRPEYSKQLAYYEFEVYWPETTADGETITRKKLLKYDLQCEVSTKDDAPVMKEPVIRTSPNDTIYRDNFLDVTTYDEFWKPTDALKEVLSNSNISNMVRGSLIASPIRYVYNWNKLCSAPYFS